MVVERRDHPGKEKRLRHIDFIQVNWVLLAGQAYRNFVEHGRGVLVVAESDFIGHPEGILAKIRMTYISEGSPAFDGVLGEKEKKWVKEYDPATEMLVGFDRTDDGFSSYRTNAVIPDMTPQAIYEREHNDTETDNPKP